MSVENQHPESAESETEVEATVADAEVEASAEEVEASADETEPTEDEVDAPAEVEAAAEEGAEASSEGTEGEGESAPEAPQAPVNPNLKYYAVHTYSNFEEKAKANLLEKAKLEGMEDCFGDILVPIEEITELVGGKKRTIKKRFFPGYMFVQMELNDQTWHIVNDTPKVTGFVGDARHPIPLKKREVAKLTQTATEAATAERKPRVVYVENETIKVADGSFKGFDGVVEEVKEEQQRLRVLVSIFGRPTPVELAFDQVEKKIK